MEERELTRALGPQSRIDLILTLDVVKELIDVRPTVIYDWDSNDRLIVAQTSPPILRSQVGRKVEISFVIFDREANKTRRFGFTTVILELLLNYEIRAGVTEQALLIAYPTKGVIETSVRLHYRVEPSSEHNIDVDLRDAEGQVHLLDLSLGGLLVSWDGRGELKRGQETRLVLNLMGQTAVVRARVARIFEREGAKLIFVGFKFVEMDPATARLIQETVNSVMRDELKARSGLKEDEEFLVTPKGVT